MRLLVTTTDYPGHVQPVLPYAGACRRAGHEVCVAGPESAAALVRRHGLDFCALPPERSDSIVDPDARFAPRARYPAVLAVAARGALRNLLLLVGAWRPDVVVHESEELAGYLAAERHGVPHVRIALGHGVTEQETIPLATGSLQELRTEIGLAPDPQGERLRGSPLFTVLPPSLDPPTPATHRFRAPMAPAEPLPERWRGDRDPIVYVSCDSPADGSTLQCAIAEALADVPARILVATAADADPAELGDLPVSAHVVRSLAPDRIVPAAAAVICNGGLGSVLAALAHGLPLVLVPPYPHDQWRTARRVAAIGAGIALDATERAPWRRNDAIRAALPGAIRTVLDEPSFGTAARRIASEIDALPGIDTAAAALEVMAAR